MMSYPVVVAVTRSLGNGGDVDTITVGGNDGKAFTTTVNGGSGNNTLIIDYPEVSSLGDFVERSVASDGTVTLVDANGGTIHFKNISNLKVGATSYTRDPSSSATSVTYTNRITSNGVYESEILFICWIIRATVAVIRIGLTRVLFMLLVLIKVTMLTSLVMEVKKSIQFMDIKLSKIHMQTRSKLTMVMM